MKIFLYKSLFVFFLALILFKLTIGKLITNYEKKLDLLLSKEFIMETKTKIREEMRSSIKKERILHEDDALLINKFLNKINKEISDAN